MNLGLDKLQANPSDLANSALVASYLIDASGAALTSTLISGKQALDVNIASPIPLSVDLNGIYNAGTNPTPDNAGLVLFTRAGSIGLAQQVELPTAAAPSSDAIVSANVKAADANSFMLGYNGTSWDRILAKSGKMQVYDVPNSSIKPTAVTVGVTAAAIPASPLSGRMRIQIQNRGSKSIYIGDSSVTTSNGLEITPNSTESLEVGDGVVIYAISGTAGQSVRVLEIA